MTESGREIKWHTAGVGMLGGTTMLYMETREALSKEIFEQRPEGSEDKSPGYLEEHSR